MILYKIKTLYFESIDSSSAAINRLIRNIELLIMYSFIMHTLLGMTLILYLLMLSAGNGYTMNVIVESIYI